MHNASWGTIFAQVLVELVSCVEVASEDPNGIIMAFRSGSHIRWCHGWTRPKKRAEIIQAWYEKIDRPKGGAWTAEMTLLFCKIKNSDRWSFSTQWSHLAQLRLYDGVIKNGLRTSKRLFVVLLLIEGRTGRLPKDMIKVIGSFVNRALYVL
jgi:hypothetical protein